MGRAVNADDDVAIIGMACVFPEAADLRAYWRNVVNGVDAIRQLPPDRWPGSRNTSLPSGHFAHIGCQRGGFIPTPFLFDPLRFKVPPAVAAHGDVDQFILLHVLGDALADAGIGPAHPARRRADVIVGRGGYTSNKMMEVFLRADLIDRLCGVLEQRFPQFGQADVEALAADLQAGLGEPDADSMASSIPNLVASRASNRLDLCGAAYCVDAACASSLIAVEQAVRRLREGLCDLALACGINFTHIPSFWYLFTRILAVSPSGSIRPFDRRADGLLIGEGAGVVVLKRLREAERDGDLVRAVIKGAGSASDGGAVGILAPSSEGQVRALEAAYRDAGVDPASVGLLEAHGTATAQGDAAEIRSIKTFFGPRQTRWATRAMGSVKSMIGHAMPAAGMASLIKAAMALNAKVLPPSLHCELPHPDLADAPFYVNQRARPWIHAPHCGPRRAGVNAFGFGGINAHVVLEEVAPLLRASRAVAASGPPREPLPPTVERPPYPDLHRPSELLVFSAPTTRELATRLRRAAHFAGEDREGFDLEDLAWTLAGEFQGAAPCRLAFVADALDGPDPDLVPQAGRRSALAARLEALADSVERDGGPPREEGLFFATGPARPRGRVAGLFPGLAFPGLVGRYTEHLLTFCLHFPRFREVFDLVEARDSHADDPLPTSFLLSPPNHLPEAERSRLKQRFAVMAAPTDAPVRNGAPAPDERLLLVMGMLVSNWSSWTLLEPFGIPFEMVCGQSLGEYSALCASGALEFSDMVPRLWRFLGEDPRIAGLGSLAFAGATEGQLAPVLAGLPNVSVAVHLSPETLIVGGPDDELDDMIGLLRRRGLIAQRLPLPPMHTPRMEARQRDLVALGGAPLALGPPRLSIYSSITAEPMPGDVDEVRRLVASSASRPVRFWQTLRRMYDDGARCFVQIGTGTLAANVRTILPEPDVSTVALDVEHRDPVTQLQHLCGKLIESGVPVELRALFAARCPQTLPLDVPRPQKQAPRGAVPLLLYWPPLRAGSGARAQAAAGAAGLAQRVPPMPFVGRIIEHEPGRRLVQVRRFALDEDLYLADHAFLGCADLKPLRDRYPVVPLTVTLELLAETAACLAPGMNLLSIEDVQAKRWIALDGVDSLDVRVEATTGPPGPDGTVAVRLEAFDPVACVATATARFGPRYGLTLDLRFSELTGAHAFPIPVERLYADGHFFHGPRFRCLAAIHTRGDQGLLGELVVPSHDSFLRATAAPQMLTDPTVLDGVGQLLGAMFFDRNVDILPVGVDRIEFYRPPPPAGTRVAARLEIVDFDFDERRVAAIAEVLDGSGRVWFRVAGWRDLLFRYTRRLQLVRRMPERHTLAEERSLSGLPADTVTVVLPREVLRDARPDRLARLYLTVPEMATFRELHVNEPRQREWLMGRIAVKDAVRLWISRRTARPMLHPLHLLVSNDADGRPLVTLAADLGPSPEVSLSHTARAASAVAADKPIGIDIEPEDGSRNLVLGDFATMEEIRKMREVAGLPDAAWITRLWCAKEAAAKALGTGLRGRPASFEAVLVDKGGHFVVRCGEPPRHLQVTTDHFDGVVLAVASAAGGRPGM